MAAETCSPVHPHCIDYLLFKRQKKKKNPSKLQVNKKDKPQLEIISGSYAMLNAILKPGSRYFTGKVS